MNPDPTDDPADAEAAEAADAGDDTEGAESCDRSTRVWSVDAAEHGLRLDKALAQRVPEFSRSHLQALIALGHVSIDGLAQQTPARKLRIGQCVDVELVPTAQSLAFHAQPMALAIVHEDDDVIVLDKPAGLVVHPAPGHWSGTLLNGLLAHHPGAFELPRAGIVHRLDKDTSGLMVVAKHLVSMTALVRAMAARSVRREYLAIAHGCAPLPRFSIDAAIGRDPISRVRMAVRADGKPARTDVEVIATGQGEGQGQGNRADSAFSALRCCLHTGRTHQIRVHLASRAMPIVADALYAGTPALGLQRQALHATLLAFAHPSRGGELRFECLPPRDFADAWAQLVPGYNSATAKPRDA